MERTIKELLILLRDEIKDKKELFSGLCMEIADMCYYNVITDDEYLKLDAYIELYRPKYKKNPVFGFKPGNVIYRVKWLNKRIKLEP